MVKYISADSTALIQGLTTNITTAKGVTGQLKSGSQYLIQSVDGEQLSGAAYTAGKGLFQDLILPTVERVDSAVDAIKEELSSYQAADGLVNKWAVIDEQVQNELIQSFQRQISVINFQIQCSNKLGLLGKLAKGAFEALANFQSETNGLFRGSLTQLKIGMQAIEVLGLMTVNPKTGAYAFPEGFDSSWLTSVKSTSVTATRKQVALENGMDELQLPKAARKYYQEIMKEALKNVPADQWAASINELNQLLLFDDDGNILRVLPVNMGAGNGVIILKNGVNDAELTAQANKELNAQQRELLNQSLLQLATGVTTALGGLGITGLSLGGTYFSGGTLALTGITQAGVVAGAATTGAGVAIVSDAISKMGVASSTVNYSFANNYNQYHKDLKPNNKYKAGEHDYNYKTDDLGRLEKAGPDELKPKTHDGRLPHNPNTPGKLPGDHAGHAFGDRFGGSPELNNLFSQSSKANLSDFKKIENSWAKALNQGKKVIAEVKANYSGTSPRPVSFEVKWSIDGVDFSQIIGN
ncbi:hypothetical protein IGL98_001377 [Enterococcus sp. DIV0840]|uniref:DNA/RNA non-specific endonuclease n=1 Tax=unclassified Enterococcus TaxID=2608891 RepID=UPI0030D2BD0C